MHPSFITIALLPIPTRTSAEAYICLVKQKQRLKVTWGKELDATTEYWVYEGDDPHKRIFVQNTVLENNVKNGYYKPYVYQTQEIEVNPKTGDLNKGCGTYEDPYIIGSVPQFLTLYRYLSTKDGENETFLRTGKSISGMLARIFAIRRRKRMLPILMELTDFLPETN